MNKAVQRAIKFGGGQVHVAKKLDVKQATVSTWIHLTIPPLRAVQLERLCKRSVTRKQMRPDIFN